MTISQQQIVDYLNKKIGYGVAKTDVSTAKSPSNESNTSPLLTVGGTIWQLSDLIPASIPASNTSVVTLYKDSLSTTVQCTPDLTVSITNATWDTNLIDWIPPQFGSTYQVKIYAAPSNTLNPQTTGVALPPDGSGNNDGWFFDYQSGIVNFADTNVPAAVAGNVIYVVGARYTGQKGISNFPNGITVGSIASNGSVVGASFLFPNGQSALGSGGGGSSSYSDANVAAFLTHSTPITITNYTQATAANTGALQVYGGASINANLYVGGNLIVRGNTYELQTEILTQNEVVSGNIYSGAYFWANGTPFNFGNTQVAAYLLTDPTITNLNNSIGSLQNQITGANTNIQTVSVNLSAVTTSLQTLSANVGAYEAWANVAFNQSAINANLGAFETYANLRLQTLDSNLGVVTGNIQTLSANLGTATNNITALTINAAAQNTQINNLINNGNTNVAAYLLQNPTNAITIGGSAQTTTANTGAFRVYAGASVGGNLYVGGNLIVQGNTYELQTEILTQNQVVAGSIYAGNYFFANGQPFGSYGNVNVAQYLPNYNGNIAANVVTANTVQINNTLLVTSLVTAGLWGNISNANVISANTFVFAGNGVNILNSIVPYGNTQVSAYLANNSGNVQAGNILTNTILYPNGTPFSFGTTYSNANVASYMPVYGGNVLANGITANTLSATAITTASNVASTGQIVQFVNGQRGSGVVSGLLSGIVNNPYVFGGTYALSTTTPTAQNTSANTAIQLGGSAFTVQFWLYLTTSPTSNPIIFGKDQTGQVEYYATVTTSGIYFSTTSGLQTGGNYSFTPLTSTWYHVAWTSDGTTYRIFINGQPVATAAVSSGTITNSASPLTVGASAKGTNYFTGQLEDFRIDKGVALYTQPFNVPTNYVGTGPNTVFYLKSWTGASGQSTTVDQTGSTGFFNLKMINATSPASSVTVGPYTSGTSGQGLLFDGSSTWYSTNNFQVQSTAPSLNTASGALQVAGGAGIAGNLNAGNINTTQISATVATIGTLYVLGNETDYGNVTAGNVLTTGLFYPNNQPYVFGSTYSNANVGGYLVTYTGNIAASNIVATGNVTGGNILTSGLFYPNNQPYNFGSTYSNANVAAYLVTNTGNISAGNLNVTGTTNLAFAVAGNVLTNNYSFANGVSIFGGMYTNANAIALLSNYTGNISANYFLGNIYSTGTDVVFGNLQTIGSGGNITGANYISGNVFTYANGLNILTGVGGIYSNANVVSYLASTSSSPITVGGNLVVGGNLIIQGNTYELQTEIITQNEIVVQNIYAGGYFWANGVPFTSYSNVQAAAYIPTDPTITGLQANIGAFHTYANATFATQATVQTLSANVGAYEIYANANAAAQGSAINTINANLGAYEAWANVQLTALTTSAYSNANVAAYLTVSTGNIQAGNISAINDLYVGGNLNVAGNTNLINTTVYQEIVKTTEVVAGNLVANSGTQSTGVTTGALVVQGGAGISGNTFVANLFTSGLYFANGVAYTFGTTYSNANVQSYLANFGSNTIVTTGNITAGNIVANVFADTVTALHGNLTLVPTTNSITVVNSSSALQIPKGPSSARPTGLPGYLRYNTDGNNLEFFDGINWVNAVNSIGQQTITGDNSTKNFTLSQITSSSAIIVSINGTLQLPDVAYAVSGNQIQFAEAPLTTDVIDVRFMTAATLVTLTDASIVNSGALTVGTSLTVLDTWPLATYRSAKYTVSSSTGTESQISDVFVTHNGTAAFTSNTTLITGANRVNFSVVAAAGNVTLYGTGTTTGNQIRIERTYFNV